MMYASLSFTEEVAGRNAVRADPNSWEVRSRLCKGSEPMRPGVRGGVGRVRRRGRRKQVCHHEDDPVRCGHLPPAPPSGGWVAPDQVTGRSGRACAGRGLAGDGADPRNGTAEEPIHLLDQLASSGGATTREV